jgi:hypothetical protein
LTARSRPGIFANVCEAPEPDQAKLNPDGSFESGPIILDDNQSWYRDRHYVAVNLFDTGINMTTMVYQVVVQH